MNQAEERRFANNPFARALHPAGPPTVLHSVALAVVSLLGGTILLLALLLPLAFVEGLLATGLRAHRWSMVAAGGLVLGLYLVALARLWRSRRRRR